MSSISLLLFIVLLFAPDAKSSSWMPVAVGAVELAALVAAVASGAWKFALLAGKKKNLAEIRVQEGRAPERAPGEAIEEIKIEEMKEVEGGVLNDKFEYFPEEIPDDVDNKTCKICFLNPTNAICLPCGHAVACYECAHKIYMTVAKKCPVCRKQIKEVSKIFFS